MLLLKNCAQVVFSQNGKPRIGKDLAKIETKENVDVLIENGRFTKIGSVWVLRLSHEVQLFLIILYFYGNVFGIFWIKWGRGGIHCQQGVGKRFKKKTFSQKSWLDFSKKIWVKKVG